jgi:hypothetical protein
LASHEALCEISGFGGVLTLNEIQVEDIAIRKHGSLEYALASAEAKHKRQEEIHQRKQQNAIVIERLDFVHELEFWKSPRVTTIVSLSSPVTNVAGEKVSYAVSLFNPQVLRGFVLSLSHGIVVLIVTVLLSTVTACTSSGGGGAGTSPEKYAVPIVY